jgi:hypothetical protein
MKSICSPRTAFCRLPTASEEGGVEGALADMAAMDKMSPLTGGKN